MLQDKVSKVRATTKNTVTNLLSRNDCFEQVEEQRGYWRLNISKLKSYHINAEDKRVTEETTVNIVPISEEKERGTKLESEPRKAKEETNQDELNEQVIKELQLLNTQELINKIESETGEIIQEEKNFKASISILVEEHFLNGEITSIEDLYKEVEMNIKFFERVRNYINARETESTELNHESLLNNEFVLVNWNEKISNFMLDIRNYVTVLTQKQIDCEKELHDLVENTSIKLSDRRDKMMLLIEEQDNLTKLIVDLKGIYIDKQV